VLARALRRLGFDVTQDATSWFRGLAALGEQSWPTDDLGQPMTPLAQIDLTGLAAHLQIAGLPGSGSFAFFAAMPETGAWQGRVVHVRAPGAADPVPARAASGAGPYVRRPPAAGRAGRGSKALSRVAMELVRIGVSGLTEREGFAAEVQAALGLGRDVNLDVGLFPGVINGNRP
jgi:hypothetical protein